MALSVEWAWVQWEADALLRNSGRHHGRLTVWPSPKSIGIPSAKACALNARVLEITAKWWIQHEATYPRIIPVAVLRDQALIGKKSVGSTTVQDPQDLGQQT